MNGHWNQMSYEEIEKEKGMVEKDIICEVNLDPYLEDFNLNNIIKEALDKRKLEKAPNKKDIIRVYVEYMENGI
jgi:hypothetical protein